MNWIHTVAVTLCLTLAWPGSARALPADGNQGRTEVNCDPLHPAHFTFISERREDKARVLFEAESVSPTSPGVGGDQSLKSFVCKENNDKENNNKTDRPARWHVSEKSELIITFRPTDVLQHVGHLGRMDVEGQVISGVDARKIEIPGYREIGKAVPTPLEQATEIESVIADVANLLDAASAFEKKNENGWTFDNIFRYPQQYERIVRNILDHSSAFELKAKNEDNQDDSIRDTLRSLTLVAQLGQQVLSQREEITNSMADKVARFSVDYDKANLAQEIEIISKIIWTLANNKWSVDANNIEILSIHHENLTGNSFTDGDACKDFEFNEECAALREFKDMVFSGNGLEEEILGGNRNKQFKFNFDEKTTKAINDGYVKIKKFNVSEKFKSLQERQRQYFRSIDSSTLYEEFLNISQDSAQSKIPIRESPAIPYLKSIDNELSRISEPLKRDENGFRQKILTALRNGLMELSASGWREIRLQPKVIGAREGDTIELTITYHPSGASAVVTKETSGADESASTLSSNGSLRPAKWTVRFLVDRIGFYINAGPRLSLVGSINYAPDAQSFRGAQGTLVPGIGVDFITYPEDWKPWWPINGCGFRVDYLDFDSRQPVELGVEGHIVLLRGALTLGVGYNISIPEPRFSLRSAYGSVGIGVEQILDEARRLAQNSER